MLKLVIPNNKRKWVSLFIRLNWFIGAVYYLVVPIIHKSAVTQPITALGCLVSTMIWVISLSHITVSKTDLLLFAVCTALVLMKVFVGESYTTVDGWYSAIAFINVLGLFLTYRDIEITKKDFDFIYYISIFLTLLFFVYSFTSLAYKMETTEKVRTLKALVMNLNNPNAAAMHLYGVFCIILLNFRRKKLLVVNILLSAILVYLIILTDCRSCIVAVAVTIVCFVFFRKKRIPRAVIVLVMSLQIITVVLYLGFFNSGAGTAVTVADKMLFSGRQNVFIQVLSEINTPFTVLFGTVRTEYFFNAHNVFLSVFSSIGIIGAIPYYWMMLRRFLDIRKASTVATVCLLGLSVQACAESAMFVGFFPFNMFLLLFMVIGGYEGYKDYGSGYLQPEAER